MLACNPSHSASASAETGNTALHDLPRGFASLYPAIRDAGADTAAVNFAGFTPMHCAAARADAPLARLLLRDGADAASGARAGDSPARAAVPATAAGVGPAVAAVPAMSARSVAMVQSLAASGAAATAEDRRGTPPVGSPDVVVRAPLPCPLPPLAHPGHSGACNGRVYAHLPYCKLHVQCVCRSGLLWALNDVSLSQRVWQCMTQCMTVTRRATHVQGTYLSARTRICNMKRMCVWPAAATDLFTVVFDLRMSDRMLSPPQARAACSWSLQARTDAAAVELHICQELIAVHGVRRRVCLLPSGVQPWTAIAALPDGCLKRSSPAFSM